MVRTPKIVVSFQCLAIISFPRDCYLIANCASYLAHYSLLDGRLVKNKGEHVPIFEGVQIVDKRSFV